MTTETGVEGNRRLTAALGAVLLVLLAVEGGTLPFLSSLEVVHVVVGLVLIPVVMFKLGTTFYRFIRYYSGNPAYRSAGPPQPVLRVVGPLVIVTSILLFASGVTLAIAGRNSPVYNVHKISFIVWVAAMSIHVLGHLRSLPAVAGRDWHAADNLRGGRARQAAVVAAAVCGIILAAIVFPMLPPWANG
jgi:hypothetical protein